MEDRLCRLVTDDEVEHYEEFGWVQLKSFVDPEILRQMLAIAQERMGEDADSNGNAVIEKPKGSRASQAGISYFNPEYSGGLDHPMMRTLIHQAGEGSKRLLNRHPTIGVRYHSDLFVPKLPSSKVTQHGGNGPTAFHQDFITFSVDRSGGMTMWFALEAYGPEFGTMSFVNGSHRHGVKGDYTTYNGGDALSAFPELRDLPMSDPITYELGDITVHSHLTIHGAGANVTDRPRWGYILICQPSDICWNGAPSTTFDSSAMKPWEPFDFERFPLIA